MTILLHKGQVAIQFIFVSAVEIQPKLVSTNFVPKFVDLGVYAGDYKKMGGVLVLPPLHRLKESLYPAREHACM